MKTWVWVSFAAAAVIALSACGHLGRLRNNFSSASGNPAAGKTLRVTVRIAAGVTSPTATYLTADNSRCFVCHINYQEEKLAMSHATKNVGCELCHGSSDDHCNDENNVTAPDKFYRREDVNALCYACHAPQNMNQVIHKSIIAGTFERKYCTDCHGDHRLPRRSRTWNPQTREVILQE